MIDLIETITIIIIETLIVTPMFFMAIFLSIIALILYPFKTIRIWLVKQIVRIVYTWEYYITHTDIRKINHE